MASDTSSRQGLFDSTTAEAELMNVAARGDVEITASRSTWNGVWLIQSTVKEEDGPLLR